MIFGTFLANFSELRHGEVRLCPGPPSVHSPRPFLERLALSDPWRDWPELCIASGSLRATMGPRPELLHRGSSVAAQPDVTWEEGDGGLCISYPLRRNHSFGVCTLARLGTTIRSSLGLAPSEIPSQERPAFLLPAVGSWVVWAGRMQVFGPNFAENPFHALG